MDTIIHWVTQYGYFGIFLLLMLGILGVPVPDEILLLFSGYMVFKARLSFLPTVIVAFLGTVCGISLSYTLGRTLGWFLLYRYGYVVRITPAHLARAHQWFERWGRWSLLFGYFVPGFRHLVAYLSGVSRMRLWTFGLFAYSGALFWVLTFVTGGRYLGEGWAQLPYKIHRIVLIVVLAAIGVTGLYYLRRRWLGARK